MSVKLPRNADFGARFSRVVGRLMEAAGDTALYAWTRRLDRPGSRAILSRVQRWSEGVVPTPPDLMELLTIARVADAGTTAVWLNLGGAPDAPPPAWLDDMALSPYADGTPPAVNAPPPLPTATPLHSLVARSRGLSDAPVPAAAQPIAGHAAARQPASVSAYLRKLLRDAAAGQLDPELAAVMIENLFSLPRVAVAGRPGEISLKHTAHAPARGQVVRPAA